MSDLSMWDLKALEGITAASFKHLEGPYGHVAKNGTDRSEACPSSPDFVLTLHSILRRFQPVFELVGKLLRPSRMQLLYR